MASAGVEAEGLVAAVGVGTGVAEAVVVVAMRSAVVVAGVVVAVVVVVVVAAAAAVSAAIAGPSWTASDDASSFIVNADGCSVEAGTSSGEGPPPLIPPKTSS